MWGKGILGGVAVLATGAAMAAPAAGQGPRQTYSERFTTDVPGASSGRIYAIDYVNPAAPGGKPHAFSHLHLELAEGARFDTSALPRCTATDAELMATGPGACPPATKVGIDETVLDTGFPEPGRFMTVDFNFFNNEDELILLATVRENGARVVARGKIGERTLDIENAVVPGTPPDGGAAKSQRGWFNPPPGYITTPPACPASGYWVNRIAYTYRDGVEETVESRSPCRRPAAPATPPTIRAHGIPSRCATRPFRAHLRIVDASPLRSVRVRLDGRRVASSRHKRVGVRIPVERLGAGRHTITVTATDAAGATSEREFGFRRC